MSAGDVDCYRVKNGSPGNQANCVRVAVRL